MSTDQKTVTALKVLVVDDDISFSDILKRLIERLQCSAKCIHDGKEIGNALIAFQPDVIFLDLILPGIDGVEIIRGLGRANCQAKIVLMSGLDKRTISSVSDVARQNNLEVLDAIVKPFAPGQLEGILQPLVDSIEAAAGMSQSSQPSTSFGPQVVYEPEVSLIEGSAVKVKWARASLSWRLDDDQLIDVNSLLSDSIKPRIAKGLLETILRNSSSDTDLLQTGGKPVGFKIALSNEMLRDESTPDYLDQIIKPTNLSNQLIMFEIDETVVLNTSEFSIDVLSRLKIKGFKLAVCVKEQHDQVLSLLDKLPIDELTINMSDDRFRDDKIDDMEAEFQIASLVSLVTTADLVASVKNVFNKQQAAFAKRCKFTGASGRFVCEPGDSTTIGKYITQA